MRRKALISWISGAIGVLLNVAQCALGIAPAHAEQRVALVVGIEAYTVLKPLGNPRRDAKAVADLLKANGYAVDYHTDLNRVGFERALAAFRAKAAGADEAFVYFAGHGMEAFERGERRNILAPTDVEIDCETREAYSAVTLDQVLRVIAPAKKQIVIVDACRENPFRRCPVRNNEAGFGFSRAALVAPIRDTRRLIAFSTLEGALAKDGATGTHSPFAAAFLAELQANPKAFYAGVLNAASVTVSRIGQTPSTVLEGPAPEACLAGGVCGAAVQAGAAAQPAPSLATPPPQAGWSTAEREWQQYGRDSRDPALLEAFKRKHKDDPVYVALADARLALLRREQQAAVLPEAGTDEVAERSSRPHKRRRLRQPNDRRQRPWPRRRRRTGETFRDCAECPEMVVVPAGSFMMGSPANEKDRSDATKARNAG